MPNGFSVQRLATPGAARDALDHRRIYAGVVVDGHRARLLYAGANGPGVTSQLTGLVGSAAGAGGLAVTPVDVKPLTQQDTRGLTIFYVAFGLVLAGFLFGNQSYQIAPRLPLRHRLISLAVFGVVGGLLTALIAKAFGVLPGPFVALAAVIALMAIAVGGASMTLVRLLGGAGVGVGSVLLLVLGNVQVVADAGGSMSQLADETALRRMEAAGAGITSANMILTELARSWASPAGEALIPSVGELTPA